MNIYVYSDESGVFDRVHNDYFVFGGVVFLDSNERDDRARMYLSVEKTIRKIEGLPKDAEVKANKVKNSSKAKLYRSLNKVYKFGAVIDQKKITPEIFENKKSKQRYLDFAYKIAVKRFFERLISRGTIVPSEVENIYFFVDEHTTATNGLYELREALEEELKSGTINYVYNKYHKPIFPKLKSVQLQYCNSSTKTLVRAADIVANRLFYLTVSKKGMLENEHDNFIITYLPEQHKTRKTIS